MIARVTSGNTKEILFALFLVRFVHRTRGREPTNGPLAPFLCNKVKKRDEPDIAMITLSPEHASYLHEITVKASNIMAIHRMQEHR